MRLLLINYEYPPVGGGAGHATAEIAGALVALGHSALVLTGAFESQPARATVQGVEVIRVPARRARADRSNLFEMATYVGSAAAALPRILKTEKPDAALVFFSLPCGPLGLLTRWLARIPYVISLRGGDVPGTEARLERAYRLLTPVRRAVLRRAAAVVANSEGLKTLSEAADPIPVRVIPNGVDAQFFSPGTGSRDGPFTFLFVGRLQAQKNVRLLLQAAARLRRENPTAFRVIIVGDGPLKPELQRLSETFALDGVVTWHSWCAREELLHHYRSADCLVNPSVYEGMPNAVLEAMACALPVIASDVAGNNTLVRDGETGALFPLEDLTQLVGAMHRFLVQPPAARAMGLTARRGVSANLSWQSVARQYVELVVP